MIFRSFIALIGLVAAFPAFAHEEKGPNGGRMVDAGPYHAELVSTQNKLELFLADAKNKPVSIDGFKAVAVMVVSGQTQRIVLEPAADRLAGTAATPLGAAPKGVVQLTAPNGKTFQAKY
ncbi:MAG: hypothetical protein KIS73_29655 [Enhydrobacter sp.]|nr:hypothetical protein [Enhydrobacter sp.]